MCHLQSRKQIQVTSQKYRNVSKYLELLYANDAAVLRQRFSWLEKGFRCTTSSDSNTGSIFWSDMKAAAICCWYNFSRVCFASVGPLGDIILCGWCATDRFDHRLWNFTSILVNYYQKKKGSLPYASTRSSLDSKMAITSKCTESLIRKGSEAILRKISTRALQ